MLRIIPIRAVVFSAGGSWAVYRYENSDDSFQILDHTDLTSPVFSVSWGNNTNNTNVYLNTDMSGMVTFFTNATSDDYLMPPTGRTCRLLQDRLRELRIIAPMPIG